MLTADAVGYSRPMAANGAGTFARLKHIRVDITDPTRCGEPATHMI